MKLDLIPCLNFSKMDFNANSKVPPQLWGFQDLPPVNLLQMKRDKQSSKWKWEEIPSQRDSQIPHTYPTMTPLSHYELGL